MLRKTTSHTSYSLAYTHFTAKPLINPKTLNFSRQFSTPPPPTPPHPWPEWVSFVDCLRSRGYFSPSSPSSEDGESVYREIKLLKEPCFSFARDRYDIFKSLSKDDIQNIVEIGCPIIIRKVINSSKRLREYVGLEEKNACDVCSLRGSCDRAYLIPNDSEGARTVDIMRLLLHYALDPMVLSGAVRPTTIEQTESSARRLLSMLRDFSESSKHPASAEFPFTGKISTSTATVVPHAVEAKKAEWVCPKCKISNYSKNVRCRKCNEDAPKKRESEHVELKNGDWNCPRCKRLNFARRTVCHHCRITRPPESLGHGEWICSMCNFLNFRRNAICLKCETEPLKEAASQDDHEMVMPTSGSIR